MQLGFGIRQEDDRRTERIASRPSFDAIDKESRWMLVLGSAFVTALAVALWVNLSGTINTTETHVNAKLTAVPTSNTFEARPVTVVSPRSALPTNVARPTASTQATAFPTPAPTPVHYEPPRVPAAAPNYPPPLAIPAPDYVARDLRIAELKYEAEALDGFVRQIRNNPYVSHDAEPGGYVYQAWRYTRGNLLVQEKFDPYMKWLDQRRDEVRREKWRLEGR